MAKGINIDNTASPRSLTLDGVEVAQGGNANSAGLYAVGSDLYLDGTKIAEGEDNNGLLVKDGDLFFGGVEVGGDTPTPPTPPTPVETDLWIPPLQAASQRTKYNYQGFIAEYDKLMKAYPSYIKKYEYRETQIGNKTLYDTSTKTAHTNCPTYSHEFVEVAADVYNDENGVGRDGYPLYHYVFTPANYTKTYYIQACIHGNEHDAPQTLLRIMQIICGETNDHAYARLKPLRDNVRFVVIPLVNPRGHDVAPHGYMNMPFTNWDGQSNSTDMNMNRNYDVMHEYTTPSGGPGGNYPYQVAETRHAKAVIERIGVQNIDYGVDYHDGGTVEEHFWMNYNMDGANAPVVRKLLNDLIEYEEYLISEGGTDYRAFNNENADVDGWVKYHTCDSSGYSTGVCAAWFNSTLGILGSVCEYIGGYFGYTFDAEQMTRSLRFRANLLIYTYEMLISTKGLVINEAVDADYFHWDCPPAMTRNGLRRDSAMNSSLCVDRVEFSDVYARWDALATANSSYITKSASLGQNAGGNDIYCYTLGSGAKKVLFLGGSMRYAVNAKDTEMGMYMLAEWLCSPYLLNQSAFLQRIKNNYTIVVLPCIDITAGANTSTWPINQRSLNNSFEGNGSKAKWIVSNGKCSPKYNDIADVNIFLAWITNHTDALVLLSGGEKTATTSTVGKPNYSTDYMTQFIVPKNQATPTWLTDYCTHLEDDRGEDAPDVENTAGATCGDYFFDNYGKPAFFINLNVSQKWEERNQYADSGDSADAYMYRNYETGRRVANIVNIILMAGGDIAAGGGLINNE